MQLSIVRRVAGRYWIVMCFKLGRTNPIISTAWSVLTVALNSIRNVSSKTSNFIAKMIFTSKWTHHYHYQTYTLMFRRFGNKCACCGEGIAPAEIIHKAGDLSYHLDCFHCNVCDKRFETGDQFFLLDDKRLVCKEDYEDAKLRGKCQVPHCCLTWVHSGERHSGKRETKQPYCTLFHNTRIKRACLSHLSCARQSFTDPN